MMGRTKESAAGAYAAGDGAAVASRADAASSGRAQSAEADAQSAGRARLPGPARFVLAVVLSFALSSLGRAFLDHMTENELARIAREASSRTELVAQAAWKLYVCACRSHRYTARPNLALLSSLGLRKAGPVSSVTANPGLRGRFGLTLGWLCGYDGYDLAALSLLSHGPAVSVCHLPRHSLCIASQQPHPRRQ